MMEFVINDDNRQFINSDETINNNIARYRKIDMFSVIKYC